MLPINHSMLNVLFEASDLFFQPQTAWTILEKVSNTHAPSQTVSYTRGLTIQQILKEFDKNSYRYDPNYANTGNAVLFLGDQPPRMLILAHADEFSYLIGPDVKLEVCSLIPYCSDRTLIDYEAVALRYELAEARLIPVARGLIKRVSDGSGHLPYFYPTEGSVRFGDRLVYSHPLERDGVRVMGSLDNAAGVTACLLAILALGQTGTAPSVAFAFTDEEEGPPLENGMFARGAKRLASALSPPELCLVVDGHNPSTHCYLDGGATFVEKTSYGRGGVVPPHLYAWLRTLAAELAVEGVKLVENPDYVSRSDDVACFKMTPNLLLLGYPLLDPHFNQAPPAASLNDIINLAKAIVGVIVGFLL